MGVAHGRGAAGKSVPLPEQYGGWLVELRRYVHRLTGDHDLADDLAQDAIVRFIDAVAVNDISQPRAWLYRAATNLVRDHARHRAMLRRRVPPVDLDSPATPDQDLERKESIQRVRDVLDQLAPRDRELLILRESGFRHREIAHIMGVKTDSVSVLAARALERFRNAYAGE